MQTIAHQAQTFAFFRYKFVIKIFINVLALSFRNQYLIDTRNTKGKEMFFKTSTIYKVYTSRKGAENYTARHNLTNTVIEEIGGRFFVVGA